MGFMTFLAGATLTAAQVNDYLMEQAFIGCTSGTRPSSPQEGMIIFETDTDRVYIYSGSTWVQLGGIGAWTAYTPTVGGWSIGNGTLDCAYQKIGRMVTARVSLVAGSTTTYGAALTFTAPVTAVTGAEQWGMGSLFDGSSVTAPCAVRLASAGTSFQVYSLTVPSTPSFVRNDNTAVATTSPWTWGTSDAVRFTMTYESAS